MQTDTSLLANNSLDWSMLPVASVSTPCCMLGIVAQSLKSVKRLSQQLQTFLLFRLSHNLLHPRGHARALHVDSKVLWVVSFPRCTAGPNIVGSSYIRLHTTANTDPTTHSIVDPPVLGVVRQ